MNPSSESSRPVPNLRLLQSVSSDTIQRKDGFYLTFPFLGTAGSVAANYDQVFIARHPLEILRVSACWSAPSASGTLQLEILTGTQAPGSGTSVLITPIDTSTSANVVNYYWDTDLTSDRQLLENDRLAFVDGGSLAGLTGLQVVLYCKFLGRGDYR